MIKDTEPGAKGSDAAESGYVNRRNAIKAFSLASLAMSGAAIPAFAAEASLTASRKLTHTIYGSVSELKQEALKEGELVRVLGYFKLGDGGEAEYIVKKGAGEAEAGAIKLAGDTYASLTNVSSVNYKMFGAVGDGQNDDGIQIRAAHTYANLMNLPVINHKGEFWVKQTNGIEIMTSVQWGHTIFHIDEKFNTRSVNRFLVLPREKPVELNFDQATKAKLLAQIKPGATIIPEFAPYKNFLIVVTDNNDRIGVRSGEVYAGRSTKAREEFFFIEEHGRIIGDLAWGFKDYTKITAYPGSNSYLIIEGGTFYFSGESLNEGGGGYVNVGFKVTRSRTVIRNQWVGLEKGKADVAMAPRTGFYSFSFVYDILLENVSLIPWEKDRPGTDKDVPNGTYGIGGNYVINGTFRNVTAEGSPIHWGVFGTNLFKNFRVEQCMLNRIDVHFYCWNLYIKDSKVGTNGITVTGGGDLFVENTTCRSNSFISFRRDYGGKWDGDIRIRNCRHAPTGRGETYLLSMAADDIDYKYPIGYGRTVKIEDMVVDFNTVPDSKGASWLMRMSPFSQAAYGGRVFFPSHMEFRNIVVEGREQGMRLLNIPGPQAYKLAKTGGYDGVQLKSNCKIVFEDIQLEKIGPQDPQSVEQVHLLLTNSGNKGYMDEYALYPEIHVAGCGEFSAHLGGNISEIFVDQCKITRFTGKEAGLMPGSLSFMNCKFEPAVKSTGKQFYLLGSELGTSFINCIVYSPRVDNTARPEMIDQIGFMAINKSVQYNHINTRLGNDILAHLKSKGIKLKPSFISMLKAHHELESTIVPG
ncbi:hypothetical protein [Daejeonella sp.]|uniref:hypothetical protein n=1 Tax=Daejeonella sp. TaxID=2805397 RepID=UPI0030BD1604